MDNPGFFERHAFGVLLVAVLVVSVLGWIVELPIGMTLISAVTGGKP